MFGRGGGLDGRRWKLCLMFEKEDVRLVGSGSVVALNLIEYLGFNCVCSS